MVLQRLVALCVALGLSLALTLGLAAAPGTAAAAANEDTVARMCKAIVAQEEYAFMTQGSCVAGFAAGNVTPFIAAYCRTTEGRAEAEAFAGAPIRNQGQCVTALKALAATLP